MAETEIEWPPESWTLAEFRRQLGWMITFYASAPYDFTNHMHTVLYHARRLEAALVKEEEATQ